MFAGKTVKHSIGILIALLLAFGVVLFSSAEVLVPEASGKQVKSDGNLTVDSSNSADGYIMVKAKKDKKRLKVRISIGGSALNYDLNGEGEFEVFPLQFGRVNYTVTLYRNVEGKKYKPKGQVTVSPKGMEDELRCFLYPNQYVNYTADTECVKVATDRNFVYDFIKSVTVKPGQLPQIDECWTSKMGICQDLSAMTCAMLRSQGIPARLMIGTVGANTYHAWVVAVVNGEEKFFDPTAELNASSKTDTYTTERWY